MPISCTTNTGQKTVVVLGAGASRDFGYPLGNELFHYAYRVQKFEKGAEIFSEEAQHVKLLLPQVQKFLKVLYPGLPMQDPFNDSIKWPPFEEVFTLITLLGRDNFDAKRFSADLDSLSKTFRDMIFSTLTSCSAWGWVGKEGVIPYIDSILNEEDIEKIIDRYSKKEKLLDNFLDGLLLHSIPTFVSLNYDTLLDDRLQCRLSSYSDSFHSNNQSAFPEQLSYGFEVYDDNGKLHDDNSKILLLKPHGSLNLIFCQHCGKVIWELGSQYAKMLNGRALCPFCKRNLEDPLLVPPVYVKDPDLLGLISVKGFIDRVKEKVRLELQAADEITIIGYSFPPYDYEFRYLFIAGILNNPKFPNVKIKIVDYQENKDNALEKLREKFYFLDIMIPAIEYDGCGFIDYLKAIRE